LVKSLKIRKCDIIPVKKLRAPLQLIQMPFDTALMVLNISKVSYSGRLQWSDVLILNGLKQKTSHNPFKVKVSLIVSTEKEAPLINKVMSGREKTS
jgi:hypothetical protein